MHKCNEFLSMFGKKSLQNYIDGCTRSNSDLDTGHYVPYHVSSVQMHGTFIWISECRCGRSPNTI